MDGKDATNHQPFHVGCFTRFGLSLTINSLRITMTITHQLAWYISHKPHKTCFNPLTIVI
jgi:hypothetical protein